MSKRGYDFRDPIIQKVVEKFISRSDVGYSKYKVTLDQDSKSINEWLNNIQEELMDAVNYIEKLKAVLATELQEVLLKDYNEKDKT
jgi:DNA anti-recombination protein RmuC|tara:strand:+ start:80 stop:337 length:258 start_codon:yes stop_codon:yes gene_type:complete